MLDQVYIRHKILGHKYMRSLINVARLEIVTPYGSCSRIDCLLLMHILLLCNQFIGKYLDIIHDIVLWHFALCTSMNCHTYILGMMLNCILTE